MLWFDDVRPFLELRSSSRVTFYLTVGVVLRPTRVRPRSLCRSPCGPWNVIFMYVLGSPGVPAPFSLSPFICQHLCSAVTPSSPSLVNTPHQLQFLVPPLTQIGFNSRLLQLRGWANTERLMSTHRDTRVAPSLIRSPASSLTTARRVQSWKVTSCLHCVCTESAICRNISAETRVVGNWSESSLKKTLSLRWQACSRLY